ncbi:MAG: hypothetical protein ACKVJW_06900 [Flavobacteriales bacterium]|jgi:hypothetical protein|tara:strand:+ start:819 stop:989 length:171 start_codon:yes stop_codon:yes gene_type:complete
MKKLVYFLGGFSGLTTALTFFFYHSHLEGSNTLYGIALISLSLFFPLLAYYKYKND